MKSSKIFAICFLLAANPYGNTDDQKDPFRPKQPYHQQQQQMWTPTDTSTHTDTGTSTNTNRINPIYY